MDSECHVIAILDDEPARISSMLACLQKHYPQYTTEVFDSAPEIIAWLTVRLCNTALICLDHDLGPNRIHDDVSFDPGTGRDVADFLSTRSATCPVIVHTTNHLAAPGMIRVLEEGGWPVSRVSPYADLQWIDETWIAEVRRALAS